MPRLKFSDVVSRLRLDNERMNEYRATGKHLSGFAVCGFKYRYEQDNNIQIPFRMKFTLGKAFENAIATAVRRIDKSYVQNDLVIIEQYGEEITGSMDLVSYKHHHIIEIKTATSAKYEDIYIRQLKAYMISYERLMHKTPLGSLWIYNTMNDTIKEIDIVLTKQDRDDFARQVISYVQNGYTAGIESSACSFCENVDCQMNPRYNEANK